MNTPRFLYHASAVGLAGEVRRPFQQPIHAQATTALPRYGGHAASRVDNFQLADIVTHSTASSDATGVYNQLSNSFETTVKATVTGLDIRGVVTVESLTSMVHSTHPATKGAEPHISVSGSEINGLRVAGRDIVLESRLEIYSKLATMTALRDYYKETADFREDFERAAFVGRESALPEDVWHFFPWRRSKSSATLHEDQGLTIVPLYTIKNPSEPGFEVYENVIKVADFGRVHIGELIIQGDRRRLLMVHADLGSPCEGCVSAGCSDGNGTNPPDGGGG